jgi:6,7-dimethyl-8-ribityllumazine synthase
MKQPHQALPFAGPINPAWRIGLIHSTFYKEECDILTKSAEDMLLEAGIKQPYIKKYPVYGSFEIPLIGAALIREKEVDALIALGIIVQGQTHHAGLIASQVSRSLMEMQTSSLMPFAFEVLYVSSIEQARSRLDRGAEAARAVLHSLALLQRIRS